MVDQRKIAKITDSWLGFDDHGCFGWSVDLTYGTSGQAFGFYGLGHTDPSDHATWVPDPKGLLAIRSILVACGVDRWEELKGRTVAAIIEDGLVRGLEPLPTEPGERFDVRDLWPRSSGEKEGQVQHRDWRLGDPFFYHKPGETGTARIMDSRRRFRELRDYLVVTLPESRERSLALTHLQTASMFANAAIALNDPEAEVIE